MDLPATPQNSNPYLLTIAVVAFQKDPYSKNCVCNNTF